MEGSDNESAEDTPETKPQITVSTIVLLVGWFFLFGGVRSIANGYFYRGAYHPAAFSELTPVYGTLEKMSLARTWGISITDGNTGKKYTCGLDNCGYPELVNDLNKPAKVLVANNRIYQIEVDGKITMNYSDKIATDEKDIFRGIKRLIIGVVIMAAGAFIKIRSRRKS